MYISNTSPPPPFAYSIATSLSCVVDMKPYSTPPRNLSMGLGSWKDSGKMPPETPRYTNWQSLKAASIVSAWLIIWSVELYGLPLHNSSTCFMKKATLPEDARRIVLYLGWGARGGNGITSG